MGWAMSRKRCGVEDKADEARMNVSKEELQSNLFNCIASVPRKFDALIQLCSYRIRHELSHVVTSLGA